MDTYDRLFILAAVLFAGVLFLYLKGKKILREAERLDKETHENAPELVGTPLHKEGLANTNTLREGLRIELVSLILIGAVLAYLVLRYMGIVPR